jgi:cell wall-associated NlpC family hydrolase
MLFLATTVTALLAWLNLTTITAAELPPLKNGDLVFQESGSGQGVAIMLASGSLYTHMGMIEIDRQGRPQVIEAVGPVRTVSLDRWIGNGTGGRITIKRIKGLTDEEARRAIQRARHYLGKPYDIFFYESRDAIYCSELVYAAYKEGAGIEIGRPEKVSELNIDNAASRKLIEARWRRHPLCRKEGARSFDACFRLILDQTLVTPVSLARDARMELVYSNFGLAGE